MEHYMSFTTNDVTFIDLCQLMLFSLDKLSSNLNKDRLTETRKYLESFYFEQRNDPQTYNVIEGREEGEVMQVHEDYWNHPYQLPTLTPDQQQ